MLQQPDNPLAPQYYRDNFLRLCDTVQERYGDLLDDAEQDFLAAFRQQGVDAQCLYVRLVSRVGPWFREARLDYPEINGLEAALDSLLDAGLALEADALSMMISLIDQLHGLRAELREVLNAIEAQPEPVRQQLVKVIGTARFRRR